MIELKAWIIHYFYLRREFTLTPSILARCSNGRLTWEPDNELLAKHWESSDLQSVIQSARNNNSSIPIIYCGHLHTYPEDSYYDGDVYKRALEQISYDIATLTKLFLEIFDEQSTRPRISN